ncbi:cyclase family protein [Saccharopolyspora rhizosphaerae]|uniref:Cyclase family protein n=1 Tax=Saccharopolyspora rhizosphaerae TaxID=2492662 RepID=A0A426JPU3_9PSEU|nr:cyclase family protein [Saccharopolyspora rhizosphaerae]RRO15125.1 cyclase family protein [Saccharopolyspora rhizosphaerae]
MGLIDLTHPIVPGMVTYPGLPGPVVSDHVGFEASRSHYAPGTEFRIARVELVTSTGTYLDAPAHRFPSGGDIGSLDLGRCVDLPGLLVDAQGLTEVPADAVPARAEGCAVLIRTGWDAHWGTERYGSHEHPHLTPEAARRLASSGAVLVGIDSVNVDDTVGGGRPVHTELLDHDVLIVENATNLGSVPSAGFSFSAVPLPFTGLPSIPVRAFART